MSSHANEFRKEKLQSVAKSTSLPAGLLKDIAERQKVLNVIRAQLQQEAKHASKLSKYMRIAVIFLGAFAATREAADQMFSFGSLGGKAMIAFYTLMALAITVIGSISAALRFGDKATELNALVAECNCCLLKADCEMPKDGEATSMVRQVKAARKVISDQNETIRAIQVRATKMDVILPEIELDSTLSMA
ncbi:MAG TPA: hypothetical protein VGB17_00160 [Pyrinomonadaceae bacterium]|jgi:hypothetical protein